MNLTGVAETKVYKKKTVQIIGAMIVLILIGVAGYWYWIKTPQYSLLQIQKAIEKHDLALFDKHIDLDTTITRGIDQMISEKMQEDKDNEFSGLAMGFFQTVKPSLIASAKEQIRAYVEKGNFEQPTKENGKPDVNVEELYKAAGGGNFAEWRGIEYVKKDGKIAVVGVKIHYPKLNNSDVILELKMRELEGYWQLAEINNLGEFMKKVSELEKEKLAELNQPLVEQINQLVALQNVDIKTGNEDRWGISKAITFSTVMQNMSQQEIQEIRIILFIKGQDGKILLKHPVRLLADTKPFVSMENRPVSWKKSINPFIKADQALFAAANSAKVEPEIQYIKYTDGTKLKLMEKLP